MTAQSSSAIESGCEAPGRFHLESGFPDEYYAFTDGELSATVERNGGINSIGCLDVHEKDGKLYPDRHMTPAIFKKAGGRCGKRCLYGPAIQFISTSREADGMKGRNMFHVPDKLDLFPFGFKSESFRFGHRCAYDMAIAGRKILFSFENEFPDRDSLVVAIDKSHIFQGVAKTLKEHVGEGVERRPDAPFEEETEYVQKWDFIGFDPALNSFVMECEMRFKYARKTVAVAISAARPVAMSESGGKFFLSLPWNEKRRLKLCLALGGSRRNAVDGARRALKEFDAVFSQKTAQAAEYAEASTKLRADDFPAVASFSNTAPAFLKAMVLAETEKEACIRAAAHKYGFFNLWDQVWPARAFLLMGDWETAKKLIRYPADMLSGNETKYEHNFTALFIICIAEDIAAVSGDMQFLKEMLPDMKRLFSAYSRRAGHDGLISSSGTCGIDDPKEIAIDGDVLASCLNGLWHDACMSMENIALLLGDAETARAACSSAAKVKGSYLDTFFDSKRGYLRASVDASTRKGGEVFQNVSTLGMDFIYGESLLHPRIKEIAEFQERQLYHPAGRSAVPYWDDAHEMWKNCIMWQHAAHEMMTAREAGLGGEIERMMGVYLSHFMKNKVALETCNLSGMDGDVSQRANWQAFAVRALYSGIFESLVGVICDMGGLTYLPCAVNGRASIENFRLRNGLWNICVEGEGAFVKRFTVDGEDIMGTMKVPFERILDGGTRSLSIVRSNTPFKRPTLLRADGLAASCFASSDRSLSFSIDAPVHSTLKIHCPSKPVIALDGTDIPSAWDGRTGIARFDIHAKAGARLDVALL